MLCDDLDGWDGGGGKEVQEGGDNVCVCVCVCVCDSFYCITETSIAL